MAGDNADARAGESAGVQPASAFGPSAKPPNVEANDTRQAGEYYVRLGWAVFPLRHNEKVPATVHGFKDAVSSPGVPSMFPRGCNIGVATGSMSGIFALDFDTREAWALWCAEHGSPTTLMAQTPRGLFHVVYRMPPDGRKVPSRVGVLPGVDVRGDGGYIVVAPSSVDAGCWRWVQRPTRDAIADAPDFVLQLLDSVPGRRSLPSNAELLQGVSEGDRDSMVFRAACRWLRQFSHHADGGIAETRSRALEMASRCAPPFPEAEALAKVESALRYVATDERRRHSDDGNALLLVEQHGGRIRFAEDAKRWLVWDEARWRPDAEPQVLDLARQTARSLVDMAVDIASDDRKRAALKHAERSLAANRIEAMPRLARSDERVRTRLAMFDGDPRLLNVRNGTIDLRTGRLREHERSDLISKLAPVIFDPTAEASFFVSLIKWAMCGRPELVAFLQRLFGYALTGDTGEQVLALFIGAGANGKTTVLTIFERLLGDYAWHAEPELLMPRDGAHPTGVADLHGKRFVVASETREGRKFDERTVKALTGSDTVTARRLYQDFFAFRPSHKLFFAANHRPVVTDDSHAMWRRLLVVPWDAQVPKEQQRPDIVDWVLANEAPGVLRWAVDGCLAWQREGRLIVPDAVRLSTQRYRQDEDVLGAFIDDELDVEPNAVATTAAVVQRYDSWCATNGVPQRERLGRNSLLARLEQRLNVTKERKHLADGSKPNCLVGVKLRAFQHGGLF